MRALLLAGTAATLVGTSTCAWAQATSPATTTPASPAAEPGESEREGRLADIVVTAQRRAENLQRAAIPVSALSGADLVAAGVSKPSELTAIVPALQVGTAAGPYNVFYLRGVGNFVGNAFSEAAVAFNVDGVYIGRASSTTGFFYDLERLEVVKGPQGTLYGRNATGGAINVITHRPELGKFSASGAVEYGNYNALRLDGMVNVPLGQSAALRVAGIKVKHDGYLNDGTDDQDDWSVRASLRVDPSSNFSTIITADYYNQGGAGAGALPLQPGVGGTLAATSFTPDQRIGLLSAQGQAFYSGQRNALFGRNFYAVNSVAPGTYPFQRNDGWGVSSTISLETSAGTLTIVPAYRVSNLNFLSFRTGFYLRQTEKDDQGSVEVRFATPDNKPLRAIAGAYYFHDESNDPQTVYNHQASATYQSNFLLTTSSKALFGRLTYAPVTDVRLTLGARQTWEDKSFTGDFLSVNRICTPVPTGSCPVAPPLPYSFDRPALGTFPSVLNPALGPAPYGGLPNVLTAPNLIQTAVRIAIDRNADFSKFTWRAAADWDITSQNLLYASYETGFKAGGFFPTRDAGVFQPETIQAYTLGSKNRFFDRILQINLEAFYWKYKNQQISHVTTDSFGTSVFATENIGAATFKGVEIETRLAATPTTTLSADVQYLDANYDSFVYTTPNQNGGFSNGTGCPNAAPPGLVYTINCSGKRPPNAPEWTINLGVQQRVPVGFGEFVLDARSHYQTSTLTGVEFLPLQNQKAYWLADFALTYNAPQRRFYVGAFANNIFDKNTVQLTFPTPFSSFFTAGLRPPRTYGVRAGVHF